MGGSQYDAMYVCVCVDMICKLFVLYKPPLLPPGSENGKSKKDTDKEETTAAGVLPREIDPREVFMRAALK